MIKKIYLSETTEDCLLCGVGNIHVQFYYIPYITPGVSIDDFDNLKFCSRFE